ncbi:MAG: hypothetical protein IJ673_05845 [Treponema sp.]|nr:hypothetical protein [Treponema sp.]
MVVAGLFLFSVFLLFVAVALFVLGLAIRISRQPVPKLKFPSRFDEMNQPYEKVSTASLFI